MDNKMLVKSFIVVTVFLACVAMGYVEEENLLYNPGFEFGKEGWNTAYPDRYEVVPGASRSGEAGLRYHKEFTDPGDENAHMTQVVEVEPDTLYVAKAYFKSERWLIPTLRVSTMEWDTLGFAKTEVGKGWQPAKVMFNSGESERIRFQIFGGATSAMRGTEPGTSFCDDLLLRKLTPDERQTLLHPEVQIDTASRMGEVNPLFFGVNTLFWIEDNAALADGRIARYLREMPSNLLRYPAGAAAQNYLWESHRLDNPHEYPMAEGPHTTDTDEFMVFCREVGAEPIFVVNLESGDVQEAAERAAAWVRYCNKQNDYDVRYWEIGNETYWAGTHTPLEYASAFKVIADRMKQVDPNISVGAVGPNSPVATGEKGDDPWWPAVTAEAGNHMDFVIIRGYVGLSHVDTRRLPTAVLPVDRAVGVLDEFFQEKIGRRVPLALTEWNVNKRAQLNGMAAGVMLGELIGRFVEAGVDMGTLWTLRFPGDYRPRALLDYDTNEPQTNYEVMRLFSSNLHGTLVETRNTAPDIYSIAALADEGRELTVFVINKPIIRQQPRTVEITLPEFTVDTARGVILQAEELMEGPAIQRKAELIRSEDKYLCHLPPFSILMVKFSKQAPP